MESPGLLAILTRTFEGTMSTDNNLLHQSAVILAFLEEHKFRKAAKKLKKQLLKKFGEIPEKTAGDWEWISKSGKPDSSVTTMKTEMESSDSTEDERKDEIRPSKALLRNEQDNEKKSKTNENKSRRGHRKQTKTQMATNSRGELAQPSHLKVDPTTVTSTKSRTITIDPTSVTHERSSPNQHSEPALSEPPVCFFRPEQSHHHQAFLKASSNDDHSKEACTKYKHNVALFSDGDKKDLKPLTRKPSIIRRHPR